MVRCLLFKCILSFLPEAAVVMLCYNWTHAFSQQCQGRGDAGLCIVVPAQVVREVMKSLVYVSIHIFLAVL